ncbi:MAG: hypothetical protein IT556_19120 [Acetobacteraceae bacterium]|nr:hypothetical protein [Acetobacteraceae bacterium]
MRAAAAFLFLVGLSACADPGPSYLDQLNMLVGRSEDQVIAALGAPDRVYQTDDARFLGWTSVQTRWVPGGYWPGFGPYRRHYPGGMGYWAPDRYIQAQCVTTATFRGGRAQGFSLNGDCPR